MKSINKVAALALGLALSVVTVMARPNLIEAKTGEEAFNQAKVSLQQQQNVVFVQGSVTIDDMKKKDLYNYVSNLENDPAWYPGTLSSVRTSGNGGAGTTYQEVVNFGTGNVDVKATVLGLIPNNYFWFTSDGILQNVTQYSFKNEGNHKTKFTISSVVQLPEGFTEDALKQYLNSVFLQLLGALGKTGVIVIE